MATPQSINERYQAFRIEYNRNGQTINDLRALQDRVQNGATYEEIKPQLTEFANRLSNAGSTLESFKQQALNAEPYDAQLVIAIERSQAGLATQNTAYLGLDSSARRNTLQANSAGATTQEAANANAEGATTQSPAPAAQVEQNGTATVPPATTSPSNAQPSTPTVPIAPTAPPKLPGQTDQNPTSPTAATPIAPTAATNYLRSNQSQATQSYIYKAVEVIHMFDRGRFTQQIEGRLLVFDFPIRNGQTAAANTTTVDPNQSTDQSRQPAATAATSAASDNRQPTQGTPPPFAVQGKTWPQLQQDASLVMRDARLGQQFFGTNFPSTLLPAENRPPSSGTTPIQLSNPMSARIAGTGQPNQNLAKEK